MIQNLNVHELSCGGQFLRKFFIFRAGRNVRAGVIVNADHRRCKFLQGRVDDFPHNRHGVVDGACGGIADINDAIVAVKLVSFRVTFLGEVAQQGTHTFYRDRLNILEAIANIGGITDYGNKQNVMLVRTINGNSKVFRLNLADRKILESQFYYLVPNDILVVEPIKFKTNQTAISNLSFYLSAITSTLTALFLVSNILK